MFNRARLTFILLTLCFSSSVSAQIVRGMVQDMQQRKPIANAQIITAKVTIISNGKGEFILSNVKIGEPIAVRIMGYETAELLLKSLTDTLKIYLKQSAITLNEVQIKTSRNFKFDSLSIRKEYAKAFAYTGPSISDLFIEKVWKKDEYIPSFTNTRSTASLVSLNLLQVASLFGKKKSQQTKLKKTLIRDEELNYVDHVFSKDDVKSITGLEGEALIKFMNQYRPSISVLRKMTGYEISFYIKKSYREFVKAKL